MNLRWNPSLLWQTSPSSEVVNAGPIRHSWAPLVVAVRMVQKLSRTTALRLACLIEPISPELVYRTAKRFT